MPGITAYGAYLPWQFLDRKRIFSAMGWFSPATFGVARGHKAVANHDEDSLTLAVAAARDCLAGEDAFELDALVVASTTLPYQERQNAAVAAAALNAGDALRCQDVTGSLRCGTTALLDALDGVAAGSLSRALVTAADSRLGKMGGPAEHVLGDAAAAVAVGDEGVLAELVASTSVSADFPDHLRAAGDRFDRVWEERWVASAGYARLLPQAVGALLDQAGLEPGDVEHYALACPAPRVLAGLGKRLGVPPERLQDNLAGEVGDAGAALPLLMLVGALESAAPGDRIVLAGFGSGCDALLLRCTDRLPEARDGRRGLAGHLAIRAELDSYEKYAVFRRLLPLEVGIRGEANPITAQSVLARDRCAILGLMGGRCKTCGTPQYPVERVCANLECRTYDHMEPYAFSGRPATAFTFTGDNLAFSLDPPAIYGLVDFEGGGRMQLDFTDCRLPELSMGLPLELVFRRKYLDEQRAMSGYFWKARPMRSGTGPGGE